MKGFNFFDRQSRKTLEGLVASHLASQYHLPPRAAQTLCEDALVFGRLWGSQTRAAGQILFHAVALDEPAGKPLRECRMVEVRLTLRADGDLTFRRTHGLGALNRALVERLSREALEQGAVLSIEDLADLLRLSVATVKRSKQALAAAGTPIKTRGDVADIGPALTHRDRIVKLFLQGYSESEVAQRTQHTLGCVEEYLADFLRISLLHGDGYSPGETARLTRLSKGKVQAHRRLLAELEADPFYQGALRRVLEIYRLRRVMKKGGAQA
jgi:DNA-binding CsgD family transcriptional regulator